MLIPQTPRRGARGWFRFHRRWKAIREGEGKLISESPRALLLLGLLRPLPSWRAELLLLLHNFKNCYTLVVKRRGRSGSLEGNRKSRRLLQGVVSLGELIAIREMSCNRGKRDGLCNSFSIAWKSVPIFTQQGRRRVRSGIASGVTSYTCLP